MAEKPQLVIYRISIADPESVLKVMQTLLVGEPDVRLAIDPKTGSLVVLALPSQHATIIRPTLEQYEGSARDYAGPGRRPEPPDAGLGAGPPRVRVLFSRWDKDGDQKLTLEEFAAGMMSFYGTTLPARPPTADVPPGPGVRNPRPPRAGADW